jgi:regulator of sirC expression with transglutaminase-like and TPR domain
MSDLSAQQNFQIEINKPDREINLSKAALAIAQTAYPDLDIDYYLEILETMAEELRDRLPKNRYPLKMVQTINSYLYEELGFSGNKNDYYDPRNSFLNDVLERRIGIPITLSLVYLEIAKHLDLPMVGIGMPGHFLIRPQFEDVGIFIDAFNQGEILFPQDCEDILSRISQRPVPLKAEFLQPIDWRSFLARMLNNLKGIYLNQSQFGKALEIIEWLLLLFPDAPYERRDRGLISYQLGNFKQTIPDLKFYLTALPQAPDAVPLQQLLLQVQIALSQD